MNGRESDGPERWLIELSRPSVVVTLLAVIGSGGAWVGSQIVAIGRMSDRQDHTEIRMDKLESGFISFQKDIAERVTSIDRQVSATTLGVAQLTPELRAIREMLASMEARGREVDTRTLDYVRRLDEREARHNEQIIQAIKLPGAK